MEERPGDGAVVPDDLAARRVDRGGRAGVLGGDAVVDLAPRVRVEVEDSARLARHDRVRTRRDRLCLERLRMPARRHLVRDDAVEVPLERDVVDRRDAPAGRVEHHLPAVRAPVQTQVRGAALEARRARERAEPAVLRADPEPRPERVVPLRDRERPAARVRDLERARRPDRDAGRAVGEQDPHLADGGLAERRAPVVVAEDPVVLPPVARREALRAVLRHPDPVPPAVSVDEEHGRRRLRGGSAREDGEGDAGEETAHDDPRATRPQGREVA